MAAGTIKTSDGTYELTGFPAGTYYMRLVHNGTIYLDEWWAEPESSPAIAASPNPLPSRRGRPSRERISRPIPRAIISGTVYKSDGTNAHYRKSPFRLPL